MPTWEEQELRTVLAGAELVIERGKLHIASLEALNRAYSERIAELEKQLRAAGLSVE